MPRYHAYVIVAHTPRVVEYVFTVMERFLDQRYIGQHDSSLQKIVELYRTFPGPFNICNNILPGSGIIELLYSIRTCVPSSKEEIGPYDLRVVIY